MLSGDEPEVTDHRARFPRPVDVQVAAVRVQEDYLRHVRSPRRRLHGLRVDVTGEQCVAHRVPGQHVTAATEDDRRAVAQGVEQFHERWVGVLGGGSSLHHPATAGRLAEHVQVLSLGRAELQSSGESVEHLRGRVSGMALLEAGVVGGAHPGQQRELLAAQPAHPALITVGGDAHVFRVRPAAAGVQEVPQLTSTSSRAHWSSIAKLSLSCLSLTGYGCRPESRRHFPVGREPIPDRI